ncbi:MAG: VanZ family protein [Lachnospiraceae bacterium]|nr:VanZ family protein [Lachnospiraceae bacterium]
MKKGTKKAIYFFLRLLFIVYVVLLSYVVFFSERYGRVAYDTMQYNLVPFQEINRYLSQIKTITFTAVLNLIGNVIIFIPFGAMLFIWNKKVATFFGTIILSFLLSLTIETAQLVSKLGVFDVDDIILNTLGGFIGFIIYKIVYGIYKRRTKQ